MLRDALQYLTGLGKFAKIEVSTRKTVFVDAAGAEHEFDIEPPPRKQAVDTLASLRKAMDDSLDTGAVFVSPRGVCAVLDRHDPEEHFALSLHVSHAFASWIEGFVGDAEEVSDWLLDDLGQDGLTFLELIAKLDWDAEGKTTAAHRADHKHMGISASAKVRSEKGPLPESIPISLQPFSVQDANPSSPLPLRLMAKYDVHRRQIRLHARQDEVALAVDDAVEIVYRKCCEKFADTEVLVVRGWPWEIPEPAPLCGEWTPHFWREHHRSEPDA